MNRVFSTVSAIALLWQLVKPFEQWEAFRLGIIDAHGKLLRSPQTPQERSAYDPLTRVALNLKRLLETVPFGSSELASLLSAYPLWREDTEQEFVEQQPIKQEPTKEYLANRKRIKQSMQMQLRGTI
jgi:hypothetical protein